MRYTDEALATVLQLSGRRNLVPAVSVLGLRPVLMQVVEALGELRLQMA
jgi:hypothetical protein